MKNYNENILADEEINSLEEDLQELLNKSEKILGYRIDNVNQIVEDLLNFNTEVSIALAADIMDIDEDMIITKNYYMDEIDETFNDDPFNNLKDIDEED
jgi:hypothetical protein